MIKAKIAQIQSDITRREKIVQNNLRTIKNLQNSPATTVEELSMANSYIQELYQKNNLLHHEIEDLKKNLEHEKKKLAQENGKKKILDKLLEKSYKKQKKKEIQKENNLANESFLSQHFFTK